MGKGKQDIKNKKIQYQYQNQQTQNDYHSVNTHIIKVSKYKTKKRQVK